MTESSPQQSPRSAPGTGGPQHDYPARAGASKQPKDTRENRSTVVLVCGLLALIPCGGWILGCIAWSMGAADLNRIKRGEMPPEARDATRAGMILGIVSVMYQLAIFILVITGVIPLPAQEDFHLN